VLRGCHAALTVNGLPLDRLPSLHPSQERIMRKLMASIAAAALLVASAPAVVAAPGAAGARPAAPNSIVDVALAVNSDGAFEGQFDTLIELLLEYPDLVQVLSSRGQYTVFAPTMTPSTHCSRSSILPT